MYMYIFLIFTVTSLPSRHRNTIQTATEHCQP